MIGKPLEELQDHIVRVFEFREKVGLEGNMNLPYIVDGYGPDGSPVFTVSLASLNANLEQALQSMFQSMDVVVTTTPGAGGEEGPLLYCHSVDGPPSRYDREARTWRNSRTNIDDDARIIPPWVNTGSHPSTHRPIKGGRILVYSSMDGKLPSYTPIDGGSKYTVPAIDVSRAEAHDAHLMMLALMDVTRFT